MRTPAPAPPDADIARRRTYPGPVKEFWVYTGLRVALFAATFLVVFGVWFAIGDVQLTWAVVIAFLISAPASYVLLNRQRDAFAQKVEVRAGRITQKYEAAKAKEDRD
jgi:hypothetical protein